MKNGLYIKRLLLNTDEIRQWAKEQGFKSTLPAGKLHVTVALSKTPVEWPEEKTSNFSNDTKNRKVMVLGPAAVLRFPSEILLDRWQDIMNLGGSWDFPTYKSHLTISYDHNGLDIDNLTPFLGMLKFGPEIFSEPDDNPSDIRKEDPL